MQTTQLRQKAIEEIIDSQAVYSQEELMQQLARKGIVTTQATLSRDLKVLGIQKVPSQGYTRKKGPVPSRTVPSNLYGNIQSLEISGPIALMKTQVGFAPALASFLDQHPLPPIMGTLAGDDTVLLAIRQGVSAHQTLDALETLLPGIRDRVKNGADGAAE